MEPIAAVGVLGRLIGLGLKTWDAVRARSFDKSDLEALEALLGTAEAVTAARDKPEIEFEARHIALIATCFGRAFERHWVGTRSLVQKGLRRFFDREEAKRVAEIETRLRLATLTFTQAKGPGAHVPSRAYSSNPLDTTYYRALWDAFTNPAYLIDEQLDGRAGNEPPLDLENSTRLDFETQFLVAYRDALAAPVGREVEAYVSAKKLQFSDLTKQLLAKDLSSWPERHVFGNLRRADWPKDDPVPFLSLKQLYVEPLASIHTSESREGNEKEPGRPILALLRELLTQDDTRVIVVLADFGMGKSLTARTLASELADKYITSSNISIDLQLPIFVRCAADFPDEAFDLDGTVRRAWKRQAETFGLSVAESDSTFSMPSKEQKAVFFLDGLDEVSLGERKLESLFHKLEGEATVQHKFIVFSRPGVMPSSSEKLKFTRVVKIHALRHDDGVPQDSPGQISTWLNRWNTAANRALPITLQGILRRGLIELAKTPILLFMIALTWDKGGTTSETSKAALYELFFRQIAKGKAEADREGHPQLEKASHELLRLLQKREEVAESDGQEHAMLWLMGSAAWEAARVQSRGNTLTRRDLRNMVAETFNIDGDVAHCIEIGLLLALQADLRAGDDRILFGHQSFREYLIARHWALTLRRIAEDPASASDHIEKLYGARLLGTEDKSFDFLMQIINGESSDGPFSWNENLREALFRWCDRTFNDETIVCDKRSARLREDQQTALREAVLAIGSEIQGGRGIRTTDALTLRSLFSWFTLTGTQPLIRARRARLSKSILTGVQLMHAMFDEADLSGANIAQARFIGCGFVGASLRGVQAAGSVFFDCRLRGADLRQGDFSHSQIFHGMLDYCRTDGVIFLRTHMERIFVSGDISGATFNDVMYVNCDFTNAILENATFVGGVYDEDTKWPGSFDPQAHGLRLRRRGSVQSHRDIDTEVDAEVSVEA